MAHPEVLNITLEDVCYRGADLLGASVRNGVFVTWVRPLLKVVPREQVHVIFVEEMEASDAWFPRLTQFLGVVSRIQNSMPVLKQLNRRRDRTSVPGLVESEDEEEAYHRRFKIALDEFYAESERELGEEIARALGSRAVSDWW